MIDIFKEKKLEKLIFKNCILRAATNDYSGNMDGSVSDIQLKLYEQLARSGIGGIITGNFYVSEDGKLDAFQNSIMYNCDKTGISRLVDVVKKHKCNIIFQISHAGSKSKLNEKTAALYADLNNISIDRIHKIEDNFIQAAFMAKQLGADAVEVHCGHGYLLSSFLCSESNSRNDEYGGCIQNRIRIIENIIMGIKKLCGNEFPILVKVNCDDNSISDLMYICKKFKELRISAIELSGISFTQKSYKEHNYYIEILSRIKMVVDIPLILTGGIRTKSDAISAIENGADFIALSRPFISEPDLIKKWKEGKDSRCLSCNKCFSLYKEKGYRCVFHIRKEC